MVANDFLSAFIMFFDLVGEGFVALALGFSSAPTGIGFLVGALLVFFLKSALPVSFEVESLTVISRLANRDWKSMAHMVLTAGVIGAILGGTGLYGHIVSFIEGPILSGLMAGVGVLLCRVALDLSKDNKYIGGASIGVAFLTFFLFKHDENNLFYALMASILAGVIVSRFVSFEPIVKDFSKERIRLIPLDGFRFLLDRKILHGAFALLALRTGTSIAYSGIDSQLSGLPVNVDHSNIISGVAGAASALFGGAPLEPIISVTAMAPTPHYAAAFMMLVMGVLLLIGFLPRIGKYLPLGCIAGLLFLLGSAIAIPDNLPGVLTDMDSISGPVTLVVTAATFDPLLGIISGILVRFLIGF